MSRLRIGDLCPRWTVADASAKGGRRSMPEGARVPCKTPYLGRKVELRGEGEVTVRGCAVPSPPKPKKRGGATRCEGAFLVEGLPGVTFTVPKSKVREASRVREGLCPDRLELPDERGGFLRAWKREAKAKGLHPFADDMDLPFPHRRGSSPCCVNAAVSPASVEALLVDLETNPLLDVVDVIDAAKRLQPKGMLGRVAVRGLADVPRAIEATRDHCWSSWERWKAARELTPEGYEASARHRAKVAAELEEATATEYGGDAVATLEYRQNLKGAEHSRAKRFGTGARFVGGRGFL